MLPPDLSPDGSPADTASRPDAELAVRAAAGEQAALGAIFDRYAPRLLAFCTSMLRSRADAEDCLQDVFVLAATRLSGLREPDRLRAWLFAVARHECLARLQKGKREVPVDTFPDAPTADADQPASSALDAELTELLAGAFAGLPERDRLVLELADRQGLPTDEVATVLGMSAPSAYKLLTRARTSARRSLGALVVARTGRADCVRLAQLLTGWTGTLTPLLRKRVAAHIEECEVCAARERRLVTPAALLGSGPAFAVPITLRSKVLDAAGQARSTSTSTSTSTGGSTDGSGWRHGWPKGSGPARRVAPLAYASAAALVVAVTVAGLVVGTEPDHTVAGRGSAATASSPRHPPTGATPSTSGGRASTAPQSPAAAASRAAGPSASAGTAVTTPPSRSATRGATSAPAGPRIDSMTVRCAYSTDTGGYAPVLTWSSARDTGIALSVDNPGVVGSYGPSGTTELPPNGCEPSAGEQTYTITTIGGTGPAASRTIHWNPPAALPTPTPSPSPIGSTPSPSPVR
jgi:RNA polymerase sigma factor (sigma-70 family)